MSKVYILPNLRKGLAKHITQPMATEADPNPQRAGFEVKARLLGSAVGAEEDAPEVEIEETREFFLAGPVDIRTVNEAAVSEVVPADKSAGYSYGYMPYIEFYEEDFPWRYTPLESAVNLKPWLMLLACKDDEFALETDNRGFKRVTVNLNNCPDFYPKTDEFYKLAHMQVTVPDWVNVDAPEVVNPRERAKKEADHVADYVVKNPDDGISRLLCGRVLEKKQHYTMFLVPAFELGRRVGVGESLGGVSIDQLAWDDSSGALKFPVYYQWSFTTGGATFLELAWKQNFILPEEFDALPDNLKADIQETGLRQYRKDPETMDEDKILIDIPVALVKRGFDESSLAEEVTKPKELSLKDFPIAGLDAGKSVYMVAPTTTVHMTDELRQLLMLNPVFSENGQVTETGLKKSGLSETEDPWVVPPVYGARHVLADKTDLVNDKQFLKKLNLRFRNRAAAGMGVSVVKRNQEMFTNRAWGMIEDINAQNQQIREWYEAVKANGASSKKATSLRYYQFKPTASGLQADAAIRVANAQSGADVNAVDLAMDIALRKLSTRSAVMQPFTKASGISKAELDVISKKSYWEDNWSSIVKKSCGYQYLTGGIKFFDEGKYDERFSFLRIPFDKVDHSTVILNETTHEVITEKSDDTEGFMRFSCSFLGFSVPSAARFMGFKDYMQVLDWLHDHTIGCCDDSKWHFPYYGRMMDLLEGAEKEYHDRWNPNLGDKLYQMSLPVKAEVSEEDRIVGNVAFMKEQFYEVFQEEYPNGFYIKCMETDCGREKRLFVLPEARWKEMDEAKLYFNWDDGCIDLVKDPEKEGRFIPAHEGAPEKPAKGYYPYQYEKWGFYIEKIRSHMVTDSDFYKAFRGFVDSYARSTQCIYLRVGDYYDLTGGTRKDTNIKKIRLAREYGPLFTLIVFYKSAKKEYGYSIGFEVGKGGAYRIADGVIEIHISKVVPMVKTLLERLEWVDEIFWSPNYVCLESRSLANLPEVTADMIGLVDEKIEQMNGFYGQVCEEVVSFRQHLVEEGLVEDDTVAVEEEPTSDVEQEFQEEDLIDADKENEKRLLGIAEAFAERGMSLDLSISNFDGKYPIMAYPIFPDPTSFYLRELSDRFILPSVDKLKKNSISCFVTNPIFEEAFLAGMNTEMGRELLWREYPTDERGSYFRKFWDQVNLPDDFKDGYFDVKYLHDWKKQLGNNHEEGKGQLVVFVIKSELMTMYPQTGITLSRLKDKQLEIILEPTMTGWLSNDTYMAGFDISKLDDKNGVYLAFTETDKSQRFSHQLMSTVTREEGEDYLSSHFAYEHKNDGSVFGIEIAPENLVVNDLKFDDDDDGGTPTRAGGTDRRDLRIEPKR